MAARRAISRRAPGAKLTGRGVSKAVSRLSKDSRRSASRRPTEKRTRTISRPVQKVLPRPFEALLNGEESKDKAFNDDPSLDRRIIEGMLHDRTSLMTDMQDRGISQGQVLRRAAELGLSEALIRQVRGVAADLAGERPNSKKDTPETLAARTCLCCDRVFLSSGPGNRLCMRCRGGDAGLAQL